MKSSLSFAEIMSLVKYLGRYEGGFIEKNYYGEEGFSFKLRKSGIDSTYLHFVDNRFLFLSTENKIEGKKNFLPLENISISRIKQIGTDRILTIEGPRTLTMELMGGGNIFVLQDGLLLYVRKQVKRKGKILRPGESYDFPDYIDLKSPQFDFISEISSSSSDPIRTLAVRLGLSKYADEINCLLGKSFKSNSDVLDNIERLKEAITNIYRGAEEGKLFLYKDDFFVWRSFCRTEEPEVLPIEEGLEKIYEINDSGGSSKIEAMRRNVEAMKGEMEKLRTTGEYIMAHLGEMDGLLRKGKNLDHEKYKIDYEKEIISFREGDLDIKLKMGESAGENADEYFRMSKRIKDRLSRVKFEPAVKEKKDVPKKVKRVFTNYRWFINSDGNLVISGRDAASNDSVVKKYLDEKDVYFHADIHGAPSVVMKIKNTPTEIGIEEAASFAWCMSKAWNARFGNGAVYYVTKSQVSKTPESGEYLAKGAWVIRGKKNFVTHLELEVAIGFQYYENRAYVVSGPRSSIKGRKVIIIPGDGKEEVVTEISNYLAVEKDSVYPVLPPGGSEIKERVDS
jgi:predicted ribosome quality control (RQC) complex YloA/Tae2 family protein